MRPILTFLYDGACPLCLRETNLLKKKDQKNKILFIDINSKDYKPSLYKSISYKEAMANLHGILDNGKIIKGVDVLSLSYQLVGLGWIYSPLKIPILYKFSKFIYNIWAKYRLQITGRNDLETICNLKCENKS